MRDEFDYGIWLPLVLTIAFIIGVIVVNISDCNIRGCSDGMMEGSKYCKQHTCGKKECFEAKNPADRFCPEHQDAHYKKVAEETAIWNAKPFCSFPKCNQKVDKKGQYCLLHTCGVPDCNKTTINGGYYCQTHTCQTSGCNKKVLNDNQFCIECLAQKKQEAEARKNYNSNSGKNTSKKTSKKTKMPDCDDYDSYEDFMDDWDGFMPDGSDAEDYWENW